MNALNDVTISYCYCSRMSAKCLKALIKGLIVVPAVGKYAFLQRTIYACTYRDSMWLA